MKSINKIVVKTLTLILAVVVVASLAACRRQEIQTGEVDQNKTADELNIGGRIVFTDITGTGSEEDAMGARNLVKAFEAAYPNVSVTYNPSNQNTFPTRIAAGDIGDVFWGDSGDVHTYHNTHNALMPLDAYLKPLNIDLGDVYSGAIDVGKIGGKLYMAPRNIGEHILIFNKDILRADGIDYDGSEALPWEEFKSICIQLTKFDENGKITQTGSSMKIWWNCVWQFFLRGFGGTWVDSINHTVSIVDSNEVMQGLNEMIDGCMAGWIFPEDIASQISGDLGERISNIPDGNGNMAYTCFKTFGDLSWITSYGNAYDSLKIDWDFCPFPAMPTHNVCTGATGYVVYNRTSNPDTAAALALFFLTREGQIAYHSQTGGNVPLLKSLAEDDFWKGQGTAWSDKNYAAFVSYTDYTQPASLVVQMPSEVAEVFSTSAMQGVMANILSGRTDVQNAFQQLQTRANQKWALIAEDY